MTSPVIMFTIGAAPPMPVYASSAEFTEPLDAAVVMADHSELSATPKRCSLPSRLPPVLPSWAATSTPAALWAGEPCCSAA